MYMPLFLNKMGVPRQVAFDVLHVTLLERKWSRIMTEFVWMGFLQEKNTYFKKYIYFYKFL